MVVCVSRPLRWLARNWAIARDSTLKASSSRLYRTLLPMCLRWVVSLHRRLRPRRLCIMCRLGSRTSGSARVAVWLLSTLLPAKALVESLHPSVLSQQG